MILKCKCPDPSYTIDTVNELKRKHPNRTFYIILGSDSMESITKWKEYQELLYNNKVLVYPREGSDIGECKKIPY